MANCTNLSVTSLPTDKVEATNIAITSPHGATAYIGDVLTVSVTLYNPLSLAETHRARLFVAGTSYIDSADIVVPPSGGTASAVFSNIPASALGTMSFCAISITSPYDAPVGSYPTTSGPDGSGLICSSIIVTAVPIPGTNTNMILYALAGAVGLGFLFLAFGGKKGKESKKGSYKY